MSGPSFEGTTRDADTMALPGSGWSQTSQTSSDAEPGNVAEEVARLEDLLAERARALQEKTTQLRRAQELLRAAAIGFDRALADAPDPAQLARQRDLAVARALEAEAARVELGFRLDELLGLDRAGLAVRAAVRAAAPAAAPVAQPVAASALRELSAQLSSATDARDLAEARLVLTEQDLSIVRGRAHALERELAEAREQIELESLRTHNLTQQLEGGLSARLAAELRGELAGACARRDEGERVAAALEVRLAAALADNDQAATQVLALKHGLAQETETAREAADKLARALAECVVLREQLAQAKAAPPPQPPPSSELEPGVVQHGLVIEHRNRADRMRDALHEARHVLGELAGSLERTVKTMPPVSKAASDEPSSEQPTQPGMPTYIEAMEGLEELVALRDELIRDLTTKLQLERDRVRAIERGLYALEASARGGLPQPQWVELMALIQGR